MPGDQRDEAAGHEQDADEALGAAGDAAVDDIGDAADTEREPDRLAPRQHLAEHQGREQRGEHRIGARDQRRRPGRYGAHPDVVEAEIDRVVGDPDQDEARKIAWGQAPVGAPPHGDGKHREAGEEEPRGQQEEGRRIGECKLGDGEGGAPDQAEQGNQDQQRQTQWAGLRTGRASEFSLPLSIWVAPATFGN